jgi:hypothetical protein
MAVAADPEGLSDPVQAGRPQTHSQAQTQPQTQTQSPPITMAAAADPITAEWIAEARAEAGLSPTGGAGLASATAPPPPMDAAHPSPPPPWEDEHGARDRALHAQLLLVCHPPTPRAPSGHPEERRGALRVENEACRWHSVGLYGNPYRIC